MTVPRPQPGGRSAATRARLLATAERLIAEDGVAQVSSRRLGQEAGQANNSAVAYHVGTMEEVILAVLRRHGEAMDRIRAGMVDAAEGSAELRDHVAALVLPTTLHLAELGVPSYYARFAAHVVSDPALRAPALSVTTSTPVMQRALLAVAAHAGDAAGPTILTRSAMARHAIIHTCAEREAELAEAGNRSGIPGWAETGEILVDGITVLLAAPPPRRTAVG
ncbi:TetR/AcrR family transcriptional regulator [Amycolatopsis vastitatis]|uniref:TetR/AcrR family transcriptional regulator n=1 Tax=Amycolatopsis vastitatis TaxID=1905142 RepID=UPI0013045AD4|nr:TetR family transcriptional regulator [Amycolatopsis vastitatis]